MTDQTPVEPTDQPAAEPAAELTDEQQGTMDRVEHAIDEAKQAKTDLRAADPGAIDEPADDTLPDAPGPEA